MLRIAEKSSNEGSKTLVLTWWISIIVSAVLGLGSSFLTLATLPSLMDAASSSSSFAPDSGLGLAGTGLSWIGNLASFVGFVVSFFVINSITKGQKEKAEELGFLTPEDKMEA
jgi:hypothetical protein